MLFILSRPLFFSFFPDLRQTECGLVQQPRCWVLPSLSSQEHAVVFLGLLSAAAQTVNARYQMRDCLHSSLSTGGNGVIGLKTWTLFESFVGIFIDFILIIYLLVYFSPVSWPLACLLGSPSFGMRRPVHLHIRSVGANVKESAFVCI